MATRTLNSPGVEIRERDLSPIAPQNVGTNIFICGYANSGMTDEVIKISSKDELLAIYGVPTNAAERYFYHGVRELLNSPANIYTFRLPYGQGSGSGFGSEYSALAYPVNFVKADAGGVLSAVDTNLDQLSGTYVLGNPVHVTLTEDEYQQAQDGSLFNWSSTGSSHNALSSIAQLGKAGVIILNKAQTTINSQFEGYYVGIADNSNINPASDFNAIAGAKTVSLSSKFTGVGTYDFTTIPNGTLEFSLSSANIGGVQNSISQILEGLTDYNIDGRDDDDLNGFHAEKVLWTEIPGRDEEWKKKEIAKLGSFESFAQEYDCEFLDDGTSAIDVELFDNLKRHCCEPKHLLDEGHYKIWEDPDSSRIYVAGVDVSEGVGGDASVIQILDITDLKDIRQVAEYHNDSIAPAEFSNKLHDILLNWGSPLVLIERNNQGGQVCDRLVNDFAYEKVVSWGAKKANRMNVMNGIISHTNTKHSAVLNQRYFINEIRVVTFRSINTLNEFKDFVRYPNGTWKAKGGKHDDRVMAFIWALMMLFNEITELYFEIDELDDYGKPLKISPYDHGIKYFENPTSIYTNEQVAKIEHSNLSPMAFGAFGEADDEMLGLFAEGWVPLNGAMPHIDPRRSMSQEQYESWGRIENWRGY